MLFNSLHFLIFFPIVIIIYFILPFRFRWQLLLISSCYFYMAFVPVYIIILVFIIFLDYYLGRLIENSLSIQKKKNLLIISLVSNFGILFVFKYWNFTIMQINSMLSGFDFQIPFFSIILPIGLSFHTFQSMAYIIEVYTGKIKAEKHLGYYWVYVMFFPQLVAGPIERAQNLMVQFHQNHTFNYENLEIGLKWIVYGFFLKLFIGDRLAIFTDEIYKDYDVHSGKHLLIATYFFAIQIYCDFSGYSLIARGVAKLMGINLMKNFDRPYFAGSMTQFWARWHISLTSWFRDYVYIPMGGNKGGQLNTYRNILVVFTISGLWHGANWTFVAWGFLNGIFIIMERALKIEDFKNKIFSFKYIYYLLVLNFIVFTWIFFRSSSFEMAFGIVNKIINVSNGVELSLITGFQKKAGMFVISIFLITEVIYPFWENSKKNYFLYFDYIFTSLLLALIFLGGVFSGSSFIYFQF